MGVSISRQIPLSALGQTRVADRRQHGRPMTSPETPTGRRMGRRSVLGVLGAIPVATGGLWAASAAGAGPADASIVPSGLRPGGEFDRYVAQLAADNLFSGTVLLVHRDRPTLARSYGMADKRRSIRNGPDTIYALGSVTKVFTAVAIAQLAQQGKLAYNGTLGTYLDGFPAAVADTVTIHHLLTHTSGMRDYMQDPDFWPESAKWTSAEQVMDGCLQFIRKAPLAFAPGTQSVYSNSGYHTLGAIVAKISGKSYYDYIRERIFRPAGMSTSDFYTKPQWLDDRRIAHPYTAQRQPAGQLVDAIDGYHLYIGSPAGNAFSNAADLVRFTKALLGNKLLNPAFTELTLSPKSPRAPLQPKPGPLPITFNTYATAADLVNNQWVIGHNGGAPGISTNLEWYPAKDWVAIVLSNYDPSPAAAVDLKARQLIAQ